MYILLLPGEGPPERAQREQGMYCIRVQNKFGDSLYINSVRKHGVFTVKTKGRSTRKYATREEAQRVAAERMPTVLGTTFHVEEF